MTTYLICTCLGWCLANTILLLVAFYLYAKERKDNREKVIIFNREDL